MFCFFLSIFVGVEFRKSFIFSGVRSDILSVAWFMSVFFANTMNTLCIDKYCRYNIFTLGKPPSPNTQLYDL